MNDLFPQNISPQNDFDWELTLTFLTHFHALEEALVRAGFTQAGRKPGNPWPDWDRFTRHIEGKFDPDASPELMGAVYYLLADPEKDALRRERLETSISGEQSSPQSDLLWLAELVQEVRDRLLVCINFPEIPLKDDTAVLAALLIVENWSYIDPGVESLLTHGH